jgi:hypothetical protein
MADLDPEDLWDSSQRGKLWLTTLHAWRRKFRDDVEPFIQMWPAWGEVPAFSDTAVDASEVATLCSEMFALRTPLSDALEGLAVALQGVEAYLDRLDDKWSSLMTFSRAMDGWRQEREQGASGPEKEMIAAGHDLRTLVHGMMYDLDGPESRVAMTD